MGWASSRAPRGPLNPWMLRTLSTLGAAPAATAKCDRGRPRSGKGSRLCLRAPMAGPSLSWGGGGIFENGLSVGILAASAGGRTGACSNVPKHGRRDHSDPTLARSAQGWTSLKRGERGATPAKPKRSRPSVGRTAPRAWMVDGARAATRSAGGRHRLALHLQQPALQATSELEPSLGLRLHLTRRSRTFRTLTTKQRLHRIGAVAERSGVGLSAIQLRIGSRTLERCNICYNALLASLPHPLIAGVFNIESILKSPVHVNTLGRDVGRSTGARGQVCDRLCRDARGRRVEPLRRFSV